MAARLCCQLDPARDVLCLRPVGAESRGRPLPGPLGALPPASPPVVPTDHGAHLSLRGLPVCALSSAGPCALRFTSARRMETTVNAHRNLPKVLHKRTLGLSATCIRGLLDFQQCQRPTLRHTSKTVCLMSGRSWGRRLG
uniref:Protein X n=1 Tax=Hepatitis B virus TaxID=10407 RepID=Q80H27_HBV|nr:truncated X protein [Hepatitis B virus]